MLEHTQKKGKDGFTLVEAVLSIFILAIGLGAASLTFNIAIRSVSTNRTQMAVLHFARDELENLRTLNWDDAALQPGTYTINGGAYAGTYSITSAGTDLRNVVVSVSWANDMQQGNNVNTVISTTFAKPLHS